MDWEEDLSHTGLPRIEPESPPDDSQATKPLEPRPGQAYNLFYSWPACIGRRVVSAMDMICICTTCPDVATARGGKTCSPNWHLPSLVSYIQPNLYISTKQPSTRFMYVIIERSYAMLVTTQTAWKCLDIATVESCFSFLRNFWCCDSSGNLKGQDN